MDRHANGVDNDWQHSAIAPMFFCCFCIRFWVSVGELLLWLFCFCFSSKCVLLLLLLLYLFFFYYSIICGVLTTCYLGEGKSKLLQLRLGVAIGYLSFLETFKRMHSQWTRVYQHEIWSIPIFWSIVICVVYFQNWTSHFNVSMYVWKCECYLQSFHQIFVMVLNKFDRFSAHTKNLGNSNVQLRMIECVKREAQVFKRFYVALIDYTFVRFHHNGMHQVEHLEIWTVRTMGDLCVCVNMNMNDNILWDAWIELERPHLVALKIIIEK